MRLEKGFSVAPSAAFNSFHSLHGFGGEQLQERAHEMATRTDFQGTIPKRLRIYERLM